jgi:hypothetical protein
LLARQFVEVHDDRAQAVAVRGDDDGLALANVRQNLALEIGERARRRVFQALAARPRWGYVVAAAPDVDLLLAVLFAGFVLVQALEVAVVALVQGLVALGRQAGLAEHVEHDGQGVLGALQVGGVGLREAQAGRFQ